MRVSRAALAAAIAMLAAQAEFWTFLLMPGVRLWAIYKPLLLILAAMAPLIAMFLVLYRARAPLLVPYSWRLAALATAMAVVFFQLVPQTFETFNEVMDVRAAVASIGWFLLSPAAIVWFLLSVWRPTAELRPGAPSALLKWMSVAATIVGAVLLGLMMVRAAQIRRAYHMYGPAYLVRVAEVLPYAGNFVAAAIVWRGSCRGRQSSA